MRRLRVPRVAMRRGPRPRVVLLVALGIALLAGGWMWFRDSSFVAAHGVQVSGVQGPGSGAIEAALRERASGMSTLDVNLGALRAAVAAYPQVRGLRVQASFPHSMRITVLEQQPVAVLQATDGAHTAAAADGAVLGGDLASSSLPVIGVASLPAREVKSTTILECLQVLGAAPAPLASFLVRAYDGPKGLTVQLRNGMLVIFGSASRPHAKWLSFARVLVAEGAASASYVDVRLPERPALAGAGAAAQVGTTGVTGTAAQGSLGSSSALVAGLEATIGGESGSPAGGASAQGATGPTQSSAPEPQSAEHQAGAAASSGANGTGAPEGESGAAEPPSAGSSGG